MMFIRVPPCLLCAVGPVFSINKLGWSIRGLPTQTCRNMSPSQWIIAMPIFTLLRGISWIFTPLRAQEVAATVPSDWAWARDRQGQTGCILRGKELIVEKITPGEPSTGYEWSL